MPKQQERETDQGSKFVPIGTWILLCCVALGMVIAWLFLYFGVFLARGPVN